MRLDRAFTLCLPALLAACAQSVVTTFDTAPVVAIVEPLSDTVIDAPGIAFVGTVSDNDPLESLDVVFASDLVAEPLFAGHPDTSGYVQFTVNTLPIGTHVVEFRATDSAGQTGVTSIVLVVTQAIDPPTVTINEPQSGFQYYAGEAVDFIGVVVDGNGDPGVFQVEWASDATGPLYTGVTTADGLSTFDTYLPDGVHLIQFRTFDETGTLAIESVGIEVGAFPIGQLDQDGDGFCPDGVDADGDGRCLDAEVTGPDSQDCNDNAGVVCPGCEELCDGFDDNNCDGIPDPSDQDIDGDSVTPCQGDCDDSAPWNFPGNPEACDGLDNDCVGGPNFDVLGEVDADLDTVRSCFDCDDTNPARYPGHPEICDNIDNDCNNIVDDGYDQDGDGYAVCDGDCNDFQPLSFPGNLEVCDNIDNDCEGGVDEGFDVDNDSWTTCEGDCNDNQALSYPGRPEGCDGVDNDCDGFVDEGFDQDGDTFTTCEGDCNDLVAASYPGNAEICDNIDNDCDNLTDEGFDVDGDGWTTCGGDCNDNQPLAYPFRTEVCDGIDNDCDTQVDEGFNADGDGYTICQGDCADNNAAVYPSAPEICDATDNDCDGYVNENQAGLYEMWETGPGSPGYQLSSLGPQLVFGTGTCSIGGFLKLQAGAASVNGVFSSPYDLWDIYEFDTDLSSNIAAWFAFVSSGSGLPSSCTTGSIGWTASQPISVTAVIDGTPYSGSGTAGSIPFSLSILQLFDIEYRVTVEPLATWSNCNYTYTLNFLIP